MEIRFKNGSLILLRPASDPDKLRGLTLAFFGMDEIATGDQEESFIILLGRLRQQGFKHQGWVTSTPHFRRQWIRKTWQDKVNPSTGGRLDARDYVIHRAHTQDNLFNPEGFVEGIRSRAPSDRYVRQELYGEFVDVSGVAFEEFAERTHVRAFDPEKMKVKKRVIGVDFGAVRPTAVEEFVLLDDGDVQGTWEFYKRGCTEKELIEAIASRPRVPVLCDPSGKEMIDFLRRNGINARSAKSNNFGLRYRLMAARLKLDRRPGQPFPRPAMYFDPRQSNIISEVQNLAFTETRGEMLKDAWEQGLDDHGYDAGAYCLMELDPAMFKVPQLTVKRVLW